MTMFLSANTARALVGTAIAGSMLTATPAAAQSRYERDRDGISAGEVVAGAVVIGGLAALLSARGRDNRQDDRYGGDYDGYDRYADYDNRADYDRRDRGRYQPARHQGARYGGARAAISTCVNTVEGRYRGRNVEVVDIRSIDRSAYGYNVRGRVVAEKWHGRHRAGRIDAGSFVCRVQYGRVAAVDYRGIRGL